MKEMKVGDRVLAEYTIRGTHKKAQVKGKIIGFSYRYDQFIFESLEGCSSGSPLHEAEIHDGRLIRYFLNGYGITDQLNVSPLEKRFNGLEL